MRTSRIFASALGDQNMVIEDVSIETETSRGKMPVTSEVLVFSVRPKASQAGRCSRCRRRCPGYDDRSGTRRWRTLDVGTTKAYLQAAAPRVQCAEHGVVMAHVPWARPGAKHTWSNHPGRPQPAVAVAEPLVASSVKVRQLQPALWTAAKQSKVGVSGLLGPFMTVSTGLTSCGRRGSGNKGAAGVDRITLAAVEDYGVDRMLRELRRDLRDLLQVVVGLTPFGGNRVRRLLPSE